MIVALILLGLGSLVFPPLWLVFLVVLLAMLLRGKPTVIVVGQNGVAIPMTMPKPESRVSGHQARIILAILGLVFVALFAGSIVLPLIK